MHVHLARRLATRVALVLLVWLAGPVAKVWADCPASVVVNGGFEGGFSERGAARATVADGWTPFWQDGPHEINRQSGYNARPDFAAEDALRFGHRRVREGDWAQKWSTQYATHHAGIYQQVSVVPGSEVTLRAWGQAWSSQEDNGDLSLEGKYRLSVGIDPTGGVDWTAESVVWSDSYTLDDWVELTAQATASGGAVTVFLRGDAEFRNKHNDAYWDDVCVTVETPPTATPTPTPTPRIKPPNKPTPTATPTPTPMPMATATLEPPPTLAPQVASIRVGAFDDRNGNRLREASEPLVAGGTVRILDVRQRTVGEEALDDQDLRTFAALPPGDYVVIEENAEGYRSASPDQWAVSLPPGGQVVVLFADAAQPPATLAPSAIPMAKSTIVLPTPVPTAAISPTASAAPPVAGSAKACGVSLWGIYGLLVAAVALGFVAGLLMQRRR